MTDIIIKCGNLELRPATEMAAHYLQFVTDVEQLAPWRWFVHCGDNFTIEIGVCTHDLNDRNDMMNLWKRHGFIKETSPTHIYVHTYHTEPDGSCYGRYNITHTPQGKIDFDWLLPYTPGNAAQIIAECIRMWEMDIRHGNGR